MAGQEPRTEARGAQSAPGCYEPAHGPEAGARRDSQSCTNPHVKRRYWPTVKARASIDRVALSAASSACPRTWLKSWPKRGSISARKPGGNGTPGESRARRIGTAPIQPLLPAGVEVDGLAFAPGGS